MRCLALESSGPRLGVAVAEAGSLVASVERELPLRQTEGMAPLVLELLAGKGLSVADLGAVAVCSGPGSFTGLRSGLAFAKGLAFARGLPLWPVTAFEAWQEALGPEASEIWLDARRQRVFRSRPDFEADMVDLSEALSRLSPGARVGGDLSESGPLAGRLLPRPAPGALAAAVAQVAWRKLSRGESPPDPAALEPYYLKRSEAEELWEKRHGA